MWGGCQIKKIQLRSTCSKNKGIECSCVQTMYQICPWIRENYNLWNNCDIYGEYYTFYSISLR